MKNNNRMEDRSSQETLVKATTAFKLIGEGYVKGEIAEGDLYVHRALMIKQTMAGNATKSKVA